MAYRFSFLATLCLVLSVGAASSQNINNFMNLFGGIMQQAMIQAVRLEWSKIPATEIVCIDQALGQQGANVETLVRQGITPSDMRIAQLRANCRPQIIPQVAQPAVTQTSPHAVGDLPVGGPFPAPDPDLFARPTFNCTTATSATGRILCLDQEGAKADWDLTSAYWARIFTLAETDRDRFRQEHENWFPSLSRSCRIKEEQSNFSSVQRQCILTAFRARAELYRAQLRGDALAESRLSPQQHADIQYALGVLGFLDGKADGKFGPMSRGAIKTFQTQSGFQESDFLTFQQRQTLLKTAQSPPTAPNATRPGRPPDATPTDITTAPVEIAKIREANVFLDDIKSFMADQQTVPSIVEIAGEAATLQIAIDKMDDVAAVASMNKLNELMKSIKGFDVFLAEKRAERQREYARRLVGAKNEGAKNIFRN